MAQPRFGRSTRPKSLTIELEPVVVRALRVSQQVAGDHEAFEELLALADDTVVNALVFDTKDEADRVLVRNRGCLRQRDRLGRPGL